MEQFYHLWLSNFCRKADVDSLAAWGFNSIRLPLHYNLFTLPVEEEPIPGENTWLEEGFILVDSLLSWCEANEIYLILDLHAAPGGQGHDAAISDYDSTKPSLWESAANRSKMAALWYKLAERYADEPWIGGYDLLNETNWELPGNVRLRQLYQDITTLIRTVDNNHIIFIEGNWWANDFTGLTPPWDDNMVYSFHKYWNYNNQGSIQWVINMRVANNIPIWCGESGENSNTWFTDAITVLENNHIGWSWWPLKKIESISCPLSIIAPDGYQDILDFWTNGGTPPSAEAATETLFQLAESSKLENCRYQKDVIDAMFRQVNSEETKPFQPLTIPGNIQAVDFDLGKNDYAYHDADIANYSVSTNQFTPWNTGYAYRNDGVDIEKSINNEESDYNIGWIQTGEWVSYTINTTQSDSFDFSVNVSSENGDGQFQLIINGLPLDQVFEIPNTGGWQNWTILNLGKIYLEAGINKIIWKCLTPGFNISQLRFQASNAGNTHSLKLQQNVPNPFSAQTKIKLYVPGKDEFSLSIYNILGQKIDEVIYNPITSGTHEFVFDGSQFASGIYFYRLKSGNTVIKKKMMLIK